jgi:hypothetical protein
VAPPWLLVCVICTPLDTESISEANEPDLEQLLTVLSAHSLSQVTAPDIHQIYYLYPLATLSLSQTSAVFLERLSYSELWSFSWSVTAPTIEAAVDGLVIRGDVSAPSFSEDLR